MNLVGQMREKSQMLVNFLSLSFPLKSLYLPSLFFSLKLLTSTWTQSKDKPQPSPMVLTDSGAQGTEQLYLSHGSEMEPERSKAGGRWVGVGGHQGWRHLGDHVIQERQALTSSEPRMWHKWAKSNENEYDSQPHTLDRQIWHYSSLAKYCHSELWVNVARVPDY